MWRTSLFVYCVLMMAAPSHGGELLTTDDRLFDGEILAFDGHTVQLQRSYGTTNRLVELSIRDVARVQFHEMETAPKRKESDRPPSPTNDVLPTVWELKLTNGDLINGTLKSWTENQFQIGLTLDPASLHVPTESIREMWRAAPDLILKASALKIATNNQDVVYVVKDHDVIGVKGSVVGVEDVALGFIYEGQQRKINIDRVLGVVLAQHKRSPASRPTDSGDLPALKLLTLSGDVLSGRWIELKDRTITFQTQWNETIQLRVNGISRLEAAASPATYLSGLKPVRIEQTPYFDRIVPWRADSSLDGGPLKLNTGEKCDHGISMHSRCVLEFDLDAQFEQFKTRLGFEPMASNSPPGRVAIRVLIDGSSRFENPDFRSDEKPKDLTIDVHGARRLTLEVDFGQDQDVNDRIVWANPKLTRANADK